MRWMLIIFCLVGLVASTAEAEVLVMRGGRIVNARVLRQTQRLITIQSGEGTVTLPRSAVSSIHKESEFGGVVETERYPNDPPPARQALMDGTYEPSAAERLGSAMLKLKQSGRDYAFFSSAPRTVPARYPSTFALGAVVVHPAPPPYVVPPWWYGYWGHRHHRHCTCR